MLIKKAFLAIFSLIFFLGTLSVSFSVSTDKDMPGEKGIGILEAMQDAGFDNPECPVGAANCEAYPEAEKERYSVEGTQNFILSIVATLLTYAAIIAVLMVVIAGIRLIIALGGEEIEAAKKHLLWTLGGLLLIILALLIVKNITALIYDSAEKVVYISSSKS